MADSFRGVFWKIQLLIWSNKTMLWDIVPVEYFGYSFYPTGMDGYPDEGNAKR